ncbi:MAG: hypothetical protein QOE83_1533 [Actinomycetota bacterium]|nr:hypothetical protein [Actinomycetota bacterium]
MVGAGDRTREFGVGFGGLVGDRNDPDRRLRSPGGVTRTEYAWRVHEHGDRGTRMRDELALDRFRGEVSAIATREVDREERTHRRSHGRVILRNRHDPLSHAGRPDAEVEGTIATDITLADRPLAWRQDALEPVAEQRELREGGVRCRRRRQRRRGRGCGSGLGAQRASHDRNLRPPRIGVRPTRGRVTRGREHRRRGQGGR